MSNEWYQEWGNKQQSMSVSLWAGMHEWGCMSSIQTLHTNKHTKSPAHDPTHNPIMRRIMRRRGGCALGYERVHECGSNMVAQQIFAELKSALSH